MKKLIINSLGILMLVIMLPASVSAQPGFIKNKIKQKIKEDMHEKHVEPQREKGREALKGVTYENDKRFPALENRVTATIDMQMKSFNNKGKVKDEVNSKLIFGPAGECMVTNANNKDETRMIFNYEDGANYMVDVNNKRATKMPMINFGNMAKSMAKAMPSVESPQGTWQKTSETQNINGFNSRKYIYSDKDGSSMEVWATNDISIDLSDNFLFGSQIKDFAVDVQGSTVADPNAPQGMMVRNISYDKKSRPTSQMDITKFEKNYDAKYFDLSGFEVNDVLSGL